MNRPPHISIADADCAVSQHVAALEAELGQPLLTRRPVGLTAAGTQLAAHARHILLRVDVARRELARRSGAPRPLALAVTPLALGARLVGALRGAPAVDRLDVVHPDEAIRLLAGLALEHPRVRRVPLRRPDVVHRTELLLVPGRADELRNLVDAVQRP